MGAVTAVTDFAFDSSIRFGAGPSGTSSSLAPGEEAVYGAQGDEGVGSGGAGVEDYGDHTWTLVMKFYSAAAQDDAPVKTDDQWQGLQHMSDDQPAPPSRRRPPPFDYPGAGFRAGLPASVPGLGYPSMDLLDSFLWLSQKRLLYAMFPSKC